MIWIVTSEEKEFNDLIKGLASEGYSDIFIFPLGEIADKLISQIPNVILFDACGHELSVLEQCHELKSSNLTRQIKVMVLTDTLKESVEISFLDAGVDDYFTKPIRRSSLIRKLILSSRSVEQSSVMSFRMKGKYSLKIDRDSYSVFLDQNLITLSKKEFDLLYLIATNPGKVFTRSEIFKKVWNKVTKEKDRSVDVHILRLRKKLGEHFIATHKGIGYRLAL